MTGSIAADLSTGQSDAGIVFERWIKTGQWRRTGASVPTIVGGVPIKPRPPIHLVTALLVTLQTCSGLCAVDENVYNTLATWPSMSCATSHLSEQTLGPTVAERVATRPAEVELTSLHVGSAAEAPPELCAGPLHANVAPSSGGGAHLGQAEVRAIARTVLADAASQSANSTHQPHQCAV